MKSAVHRLAGIEPDNLLGFLALLGLLRSLEEARAEWFPRVSWSVDDPPTRPLLHVAADDGADEDAVVEAAAEGLDLLSKAHEFSEKNLKLSPEDARDELRSAAQTGGHRARLWASLVSDKAQRRKVETVEGTPLCLIFGQGHQYFLDRLGSVPKTPVPAGAGGRRGKRRKSGADYLSEALFTSWRREDLADSFRWDPVEDVRYAYRAGDPSSAKYKQKTQYGANRLAAIGVSALTVFPYRAGQEVRLAVRGGIRIRGRFAMNWPIWRAPMSLSAIEALLDHPCVGDAHRRRSVERDRRMRDALGVVEVRRARRISIGKFMNFTRAGVEEL